MNEPTMMNRPNNTKCDEWMQDEGAEVDRFRVLSFCQSASSFCFLVSSQYTDMSQRKQYSKVRGSCVYWPRM